MISDENKEKYPLGDYQLIQYQILWGNIGRIIDWKWGELLKDLESERVDKKSEWKKTHQDHIISIHYLITINPLTPRLNL